MSPASHHPVFTPPTDPNVKIWRYMNFGKYVSMLVEGGLWFSRIDELQREDRFEGSPSRVNLAIEQFNLESLDMLRAAIEKMMRPSAVDRRSREYSYVNCWHMSDWESAAMWKLYALSGEAIAIQSTYARLHASLPEKTDTYEIVPADAKCRDSGQIECYVDEHGNRKVKRQSEVYVGVVHYIDYDTEPHLPGVSPEGVPYSINQFPRLVPLKYKRKSFEYEKELRAIIWNMPLLEPFEDEQEYHPEGVPNLALGQMVELSLDSLIENVYVAPTAPPYFKKAVASVTSRYDLERKPIHSSLADDPVR